MEKHPQDKSTVDTSKITGTDPDRYEQGYGSFNEKDYEKKAGDSDVKQEKSKASITVGMNEDKSTVSETSAPSEDVSQAK